MEQFKEIHSEIQATILGYERPLRVDEPCQCGRGVRRFRCRDCPWHPPVCSACLLQTHQYEPFHWAEVWTGHCFRQIDLVHIGLRIYLGHEGQPCPALNEESVGVRITALDTNGIHETIVFFCECSASLAPHSRVLQLFRSRLFPYTTNMPETVVTFRCLEDFRLHTNTSRKSAYDYMKILYRRCSEETRLNETVCILEFALSHLC